MAWMNSHKELQLTVLASSLLTIGYVLYKEWRESSSGAKSSDLNSKSSSGNNVTASGDEKDDESEETEQNGSVKSAEPKNFVNYLGYSRASNARTEKAKANFHKIYMDPHMRKAFKDFNDVPCIISKEQDHYPITEDPDQIYENARDLLAEFSHPKHEHYWDIHFCAQCLSRRNCIDPVTRSAWYLCLDCRSEKPDMTFYNHAVTPGHELVNRNLRNYNNDWTEENFHGSVPTLHPLAFSVLNGDSVLGAGGVGGFFLCESCFLSHDERHTVFKLNAPQGLASFLPIPHDCKLPVRSFSSDADDEQEEDGSFSTYITLLELKKISANLKNDKISPSLRNSFLNPDTLVGYSHFVSLIDYSLDAEQLWEHSIINPSEAPILSKTVYNLYLNSLSLLTLHKPVEKVHLDSFLATMGFLTRGTRSDRAQLAFAGLCMTFGTNVLTKDQIVSFLLELSTQCCDIFLKALEINEMKSSWLAHERNRGKALNNHSNHIPRTQKASDFSMPTNDGWWKDMKFVSSLEKCEDSWTWKPRSTQSDADIQSAMCGAVAELAENIFYGKDCLDEKEFLSCTAGTDDQEDGEFYGPLVEWVNLAII